MRGMLSVRPVDGPLAPAWWRTVPAVVVGFSGTMFSLAMSPAGNAAPDDHLAMLLTLLGFGIALGGPVALIWRHRFPVAFAVTAAVVPLAVPVGNTLAFITLSALVGRRRGSGVWAVAGLTAVTSTVVVVRDALARPVGASILQTTLAPGDAPVEVGAPTIAIIAVLGWGLSVGLGLAVRGARETRHAREAVSTERAASSQLGDELARRAERERIAREVHDVLGHRLSLLSLHAAALEANAGGDARLRASASLVRESAAGAMGDLRSLLEVLRQTAGDQPDLPLTALPGVVQESFGSGQLLASSIFVADADQADPTLSRAVYRIVQEVLTNARKHAPGQRVELSVTGGPPTGIAIDVRNPLTSDAARATPGERRGLAGIAERAELLGGRVQYGLDDGSRMFRVRVELPWRARGQVA